MGPHDAKKQAHNGHDDHNDPRMPDVSHISRRHALIDNGRHEKRYDHLHHNLQYHGHRSHDRGKPEFLYFRSQSGDDLNGSVFFIRSFHLSRIST